MALKRTIPLACTAVLLAGVAAGCGSDSAASDTGNDAAPFPITIGLQQVNDIPAKGNAFEQAVEKYTNTKLNIQWIPQSAFDDKINIMIASGDLPMVLRVNYVPTIVSAIQSGQFWEIGPYLKDYKNLAAQDPQYYNNVMVDGKQYSLPVFRNIGRSVVVYRKDLFDKLNLQPPKTFDDWYNVIKAISQSDMDKTGRPNVYGAVLDKSRMNIILTLMAVSQGAPNKWGVDANGKFTPEFLTTPYMDTLKLFRRLFAENLINQDFPVLDAADADTMVDSGRLGMRLQVAATSAINHQDRIVKNVPDAKMEIFNFEGPQGIRVAGEPGYNGMLVFPKSSVKTEADLKKILTFLDKMMDEPMSTLQRMGVEGVHYQKLSDGKVEYTDLTAFNREIKPYRDNLLNVDGYNVPPLKQDPLGEKGSKMELENLKYSINNPALSLSSKTFSERGKELEQMLTDAKTMFIMGKIDEAGWNAEVDKWRKAGGDLLIKEYEESYAKLAK